MSREKWKARAQWIWHKLQDICAVWLQPILATLAVISGAFLTYDFKGLQARNPAWSGPVAWVQDWVPLAFTITALASAVVGFIVASRGRMIKRLEDELVQSRRQAEEISNVIVILFDGLLLNLANKLDLEQGAQARLSLYVHDRETKSFVPCGRYSRNPEFSSPGRTSYPDDQGCIADGWRKGWHFDSQIPPANQSARRSAYNLRTYNLPEHVTDGTRMKSTLYAVARVHNREEKPIAVLVFESVSGESYAEDILRSTIEGVVHDYARVIQELRAFVPNPANAAESGL